MISALNNRAQCRILAAGIPTWRLRAPSTRTTALGAWWGELRSDLRDTDFGACWLWSPLAAAVPRESPSDLARLWHGYF